GSIRRWLAALPASAGSPAGVLQALWKLPDDGAGDLCNTVARAGLACLREQGNLNLLEAFDRPAVVNLQLSGYSVQVVVETLSADGVTLAAGPGYTHRFPVSAFAALWYGRMWLLWRPPHGVSVMRPGMTGAAVSWLRHALGLPVRGADSTYDKQLEAAVRAFQRRHALVPDGIAGPETLMVLRRSLGDVSGPRLRDG
ncbi:MAG: peptidoglycan-binding domain-containing protein, partial [Gammaproteobacteria bacterium]